MAKYLHERTGAVAQAQESLAHHWRQAGEPRRAVDCLLVAADQAGLGWAKERAVTLFRAALSLVPEDDEATRREIMRRLAVAMQAAFHVPDAARLRDG